MMELNLPAKLERALEREAAEARRSLHAQIVRKLETHTAPSDRIPHARMQEGLDQLTAFLVRVPAIQRLHAEVTPSGWWWAKFDIDIEHPLAWHVVQYLAYVLNELSVTERLPTVFKPTSPPPYLNGGPEFLHWVIEAAHDHVNPYAIVHELQSRLPNPVDDAESWKDVADSEGAAADYWRSRAADIEASGTQSEAVHQPTSTAQRPLSLGLRMARLLIGIGGLVVVIVAWVLADRMSPRELVKDYAWLFWITILVPFILRHYYTRWLRRRQ